MVNIQKWKSRKESYNQALAYINGREKGVITSFQTPWLKINDSGINGIEWQSTIIAGARPAGGKTTFKDQIFNNAFDLNPNEIFRALDFRFEMVSKVTAIREYSSMLGRSYKYLCSAEGKLSKEDFSKCHLYSKEKADSIKYPIDIIEDPCTVNEFINIIHEYMKVHKQLDGSYTKTLIGVDHSLLFTKAVFEKSDQDMLANLGKALTYLKKQYPIIFIVLSQLNRDIERPERSEDGRYGNYILTSDIFGSDCLLHHADLVYGFNRPALQKIRFYGPDRYIIDDDNIMVIHTLKSRNGDTRLSFFKAEFNKMRLVEIPTPPMAPKRIST